MQTNGKPPPKKLIKASGGLEHGQRANLLDGSNPNPATGLQEIDENVEYHHPWTHSYSIDLNRQRLSHCVAMQIFV